MTWSYLYTDFHQYFPFALHSYLHVSKFPPTTQVKHSVPDPTNLYVIPAISPSVAMPAMPGTHTVPTLATSMLYLQFL